MKPKCWKTERLKCQKAEKLLKNSYILTSLSCSFCHWYSLEHTEKYQMFPNGQINKQHVVLGTQSKTFPDLRSVISMKLTEARNMWFKFSLNPLKFSPLTRETNTHKKWAIFQNIKFLNNKVFSYTKKPFCKLAQLFCVSIFLVKGNWKELRENLNHIFLAWVRLCESWARLRQ